MLRKLLVDESVTNRVTSSSEGRMLQRPPPLIRIFLPPSTVRSSSSTSGLGDRNAAASAAKIAAIVPAAPAPTITIRPEPRVAVTRKT